MSFETERDTMTRLSLETNQQDTGVQTVGSFNGKGNVSNARLVSGTALSRAGPNC